MAICYGQVPWLCTMAVSMFECYGRVPWLCTMAVRHDVMELWVPVMGALFHGAISRRLFQGAMVTRDGVAFLELPTCSVSYLFCIL